MQYRYRKIIKSYCHCWALVANILKSLFFIVLSFFFVFYLCLITLIALLKLRLLQQQQMLDSIYVKLDTYLV